MHANIWPNYTIFRVGINVTMQNILVSILFLKIYFGFLSTPMIVEFYANQANYLLHMGIEDGPFRCAVAI